MYKNIALAQALNARLCHDLASSIGTIDNCLKLSGHESKKIAIKAKSLAAEESENLVAKIKFFRVAYGFVDEGASMSLVNISKLVTDFLKVKASFHFGKGMIYIDSQLAQIALCFTVLASENINNSGSVHLYLSEDKKNPVTLLGKGKNIFIQDASIEMLQNTADHPLSVKTCRHHYIYSLAEQLGYKIKISKNSDSIEYNLIKK